MTTVATVRWHCLDDMPGFRFLKTYPRCKGPGNRSGERGMPNRGVAVPTASSSIVGESTCILASGSCTPGSVFQSNGRSGKKREGKTERGARSISAEHLRDVSLCGQKKEEMGVKGALPLVLNANVKRDVPRLSPGLCSSSKMPCLSLNIPSQTSHRRESLDCSRLKVRRLTKSSTSGCSSMVCS